MKSILILILVFSQSIFAANCKSSGSDALAYKDRGTHCEGVKPQLVAAYDIELISAMAYRESTTDNDGSFKLKFCLPNRTNNVHIKVRELEYKHYYRMDQLTMPFVQGCNNNFEWLTADVIQQLDGLNLLGLVALARLNNQRPNVKEEVAPIILYKDGFPNNISKYSFTFKTNRDVKLRYSIRDERAKQNIVPKTRLSRKTGNKPFTITWNDLPSQSGFYKLKIKGYFISNGETLQQSVRFYHKPNIQ